MRDKILAALAAANVKTDGLDDDALLAAFNKLQAKPETQNNSEDIKTLIAEAVTNAVKPLQDQLIANADKELNQAVEAVVALNKGIDEAAAKAMGLAACNAFLAANGHVPFNAVGGRPASNTDKGCLDLELPSSAEA